MKRKYKGSRNTTVRPFYAYTCPSANAGIHVCVCVHSSDAGQPVRAEMFKITPCVITFLKIHISIFTACMSNVIKISRGRCAPRIALNICSFGNFNPPFVYQIICKSKRIVTFFSVHLCLEYTYSRVPTVSVTGFYLCSYFYSNDLHSRRFDSECVYPRPCRSKNFYARMHTAVSPR